MDGVRLGQTSQKKILKRENCGGANVLWVGGYLLNTRKAFNKNYYYDLIKNN